MRKKLLSILLCVTMVAALMTGCGDSGSSDKNASNEDASEEGNTVEEDGDTAAKEESANIEEEAEEVTLRVAFWGNQTRIDRMTEAFNVYMDANPNITIDLQSKPFGDHFTDLASAATTDTMPDLFFMSVAYVASYLEAEKMAELTPYMESGALDLSNVSESVLSICRSTEGGLYGVPVGLNAPALCYNKTLLEENDIEIHNYMTIDEFVDICREVYEKTGVKTDINDTIGTIQFMVRAKDNTLYGDGGFGVDSYEDFLPFFNILETGYNEGWLIDQTIVSASSSSEESPLVYYTTPETQSWCRIMNSNLLVSYQDYAPEGVELALVTKFSDEIEKSNFLSQSMQWSVAANSEHMDETIQLLDWVINSEEFHSILLGESGVPANSEIADYVATLIDDLTAETFSFVNDVIIPKSSASDPVAPEGSAEIDDLSSGIHQRLCYGEINAEEAAKELFEEGNKILADE